MSRVTIPVRPNPDPMNSGKCHRDETIFASLVLRVECAIFILLSAAVFITRSARIARIRFDFRFFKLDLCNVVVLFFFTVLCFV